MSAWSSVAMSAVVLLAPTVTPMGVWPLSGEPTVVHGFAPPAVAWGAGHRGVDLAGVPGQQVRAALPGTVSFVGTIAGKRVVVVSHGETRTSYEPVTGSVARGEQVRAGEPIGTLDPAPSHCVPAVCLHWGWLRGEEYLDPLGLVELPPVRLLPLAGGPVPRSVAPTGWGRVLFGG